VLASGRAIGIAGERIARERPDSMLGRRLASGKEIAGGLVTELAHDGDPDAVEILAWVGRRLGAGIAGIVNALDPALVVVGGGAVAGGDLLLEPARDEAMARVLPPHRDVLRIVPAAFGDESGMLGAAVMAFEELGQA
jgi:glucokinase